MIDMSQQLMMDLNNFSTNGLPVSNTRGHKKIKLGKNSQSIEMNQSYEKAQQIINGSVLSQNNKVKEVLQYQEQLKQHN